MEINSEELKQSFEGMSRGQLLNEAADRAQYFFRKIDDNYEIPDCHPQIQQVLRMVIAASL